MGYIHTAQWRFEESVQLALTESHGLVFNRSKTKGSGDLELRVCSSQFRHEDRPPPLLSLLNSGPRALLLEFHLAFGLNWNQIPSFCLDAL